MLRILKNTLKKHPFPVQISNPFLRHNKKSKQESMRPLTSSEFHQFSGGPIYFCLKYLFWGEKRRQTGPIRNQFFQK